ncbi:hypothetical protein BB558_002865 [Smittium angustum]|uniref:MMS19 nucleotide excision repair protein n=1 Tax=Smittium angustum TaxID=133377 RepID=A0A2U1J7R1_SMIAN|nr:hypothetical protein BB558_002865 [Smittium angustum]
MRERAQIISAMDESQSTSKNNSTETIEEIKQDIVSGRSNLLSYVGELESYLTSEEATKRVKGMEVLVNILKNLTSNEVNKKTASVLVMFFSLRTSDAVSIPQILDGMWALMNMNDDDEALQRKIVTNVLNKIHVQSYQQRIRNLTFQIIDRYLSIKGKKLINKKTIIDIVTSIDGERDPRNLMLIFDIVTKLVCECDISEAYKASYSNYSI